VTIGILIPAYLAALVLGLVLSFTTRRQFLRTTIRIATGFLAIPLCLFVLARTIFWLAEPPSLAKLQRDFPSKRTDLETILQMSNTDLDFPRVAPTWVVYWPNEGTSETQSQGDPNAKLPEMRWQEYRSLYAKNDIQLGFSRDKSGDVFVMMDSVGLLNRGHTSGYLYCAATTEVAENRFYPCSLNQEKGQQKHSWNPRKEAYSFQRLADRWYAYDEGPY
jgi:hypothetical protein